MISSFRMNKPDLHKSIARTLDCFSPKARLNARTVADMRADGVMPCNVHYHLEKLRRMGLLDMDPTGHSKTYFRTAPRNSKKRK